MHKLKCQFFLKSNPANYEKSIDLYFKNREKKMEKNKETIKNEKVIEKKITNKAKLTAQLTFITK